MSPFSDGKNSCFIQEALFCVSFHRRTHRRRKGHEKKGDEAYSSTPIDPLSKPRKVHDKSTWKVSQDAVHRVNLRNAQEKGLQL